MQNDPLDGRIRESLADIVGQAPLAPDFDDLRTEQSSHRRFPVVVAAAAVAVALTAAVAAVLAGGDGDGASVATSADRDTSAAAQGENGPCERRALAISESDMDLAVFLDPGAPPGDWQAVADEILSRADVAEGRLVDQESTFEEFGDLYAGRPELVESVTPQLLPPRVEVKLAEGASTESVAATLDGPGVRDVFTWAEMTANAQQTCRLAGGAPGDDEASLPTTTVADPRTGSTPVDGLGDGGTGVEGVCAAAPGSVTDVANEPDWRRHADYRTWTDAEGCLVRIDVLAERAGPDHCGWGDADVLITGTPLGQPYRTADDDVQFVRDPRAVFGQPELAAGYDPDAEVPDDAQDSGFRRGNVSLWHVPGDQSAVWLVDGNTAERWPAGDPPLCR